MSDRIEVLDKGYVRLVDVMGSDLSVVNAARASFAKESEELSKSDIGLIKFLARNGHSSPFRHAFMSFEIKAPLMVARQWWKYVVGSDHTMDGWNEASFRYIEPEDFYVPAVWREAPENRKQGSGGELSPEASKVMRDLLETHVDTAMYLYKSGIGQGLAPEQLRLFLPAYALYSTWRWSASLQSITWFLHQRLEDDAQLEIREYARAVHQLAYVHFPESINAWVGERGVEDGKGEVESVG